MSRRKIFTAILAAVMLFSAIPARAEAPDSISSSVGVESTASQELTYTDSVLASFENPTHRQKPMARMWFPDAGAGIDEYDTIQKQIQELAEAGFGGVEVTMLADGSNFTNEESKVVGWGTDAWVQLLKKVLHAANEVEGGFVVDITITAHWPTVINTIDPNDDAASQETSYTVQKITAEDLTAGTVIADLPSQRTVESHKNDPANFLFTDTYVTSALVKVDSVSGNSVTYDLDSIIDLSQVTRAAGGEGYAAGVPDRSAAEQYGFDYDQILEQYGAEPAEDADFSQSFNGKIDSAGNRKRMADWQSIYQSDLSGITQLAGHAPSTGNSLQAGDYALVTVYRRGTGQVMSDGGFGGSSVQMYGRTYTTNYFARNGVDAFLTYWDENILDNELIELLKANASTIFEDSIEASASTNFWSYNILDELDERDYAYTNKLPLVVVLGANSFNDATEANKIKEDYNLLMGDLYKEEHAKPISDWASAFNYTYRAQPYSLVGLDIAGASATIDVPEGDNGTKGDGLRTISSAVNMTDKTYLSMEAVTGMRNHTLNWADVITEVAQNFSGGVNRVILHGTPYSKSFNGYNASWPGWMAFGHMFADSYTYRNPYWEDAATIGDYMARNQAVLQSGTAKIDVAILNDKTTSFSNQKGNNFQTLLDNGFSYNILSEEILQVENAKVTDGVIYKDGPGYKALVLNGVSTISTDAMAVVLEFAQAGLPVILHNSTPSTIYGSDNNANSTAAMLALYDQLLQLSNVVEAATQEDILTALDGFEVVPDARYQASQLETTHYTAPDESAEYYYLFNNPYPGSSGMVNNGQASNYKNGSDVNATVTLTGEGVPYLLDAWTGNVTPIALYQDNGDGTVTLNVALSGGESAIIAILPIAEDGIHATATTGGTVVYHNGEMMLVADQAGDYTVTMSDGTAQMVAIETVEDAFALDTGWNLELQSWGPDEDALIQEEMIPGWTPAYTLYQDPSDTKITTVYFDDIDLVNWSQLPADQATLNELGVYSMANVIGVGYYTNTFTLPDDWKNDTQGAYLDYSYLQDQVTGILVNGTSLGPVDSITDRVEIGSLLETGEENTVVIKLSTPMFNRVKIEHSGFNGSGNLLEHGLQTVSVTPYGVATVVSSGERLALSTDAYHVKRDGYANITTEFTEPVNSNTAIINYTFDTDLFEFADFHEETGVTVISQEATTTGAKVVVMIPSYNTQTYGRLAIHAKADAPLTNSWATVKATAEYVVMDENGDKEIKYSSAATSFTTRGNGEEPDVEGDTNDDGIVDLIDLSNMIDWFGIDNSDSEWDDWYTFFDYNNNGEIDIYDIVYVAQKIK